MGIGANRPQIDAGTLARADSPLPGPIGTGASAVTNSTQEKKGEPEKDAEIEALDLDETTRKAAYELKKAHPSIKFTSGRRSKEDQARAMASNVVKNRKWIEQTYADSGLRKKCQDWVNDNSDKKTQAEIADGLLSVFNDATDADLGKFSKHLSGSAFDVQPVDKDAEAIKKTIRGLTGLDKFLDTEGGLTRWHAQFK